MSCMFHAGFSCVPFVSCGFYYRPYRFHMLVIAKHFGVLGFLPFLLPLSLWPPLATLSPSFLGATLHFFLAHRNPAQLSCDDLHFLCQRAFWFLEGRWGSRGQVGVQREAHKLLRVSPDVEPEQLAPCAGCCPAQGGYIWAWVRG